MLNDENRPMHPIVYDTRTAAGILAWAEATGSTRKQVLQVARCNMNMGILTDEDVRGLIDAGYVEVRASTPETRRARASRVRHG
jgi:hypothetical protein